MKKNFKYAIIVLAGCMSAGLTACSSDDEPEFGEGELWVGDATTPAYVSDAAVYSVNSGVQCPFKSIELTESGDYIVTPSAASYSMADSRSESAAKHGIFRKHKAPKSRTDLSTSGYTYGTYTKNTDGSYNLKGLGTMTYSNGTIELSLTDGTNYIAGATKDMPSLAANDLNLRFCRTWKVTGAVVDIYDKNGRKLDSWIFSEAEIQEEYVKYILVSRCGSYVSIDWDETIDDNGSWSWINTSEQRFEWVDEFGDTGTNQVLFNGNKAMFRDSWTDYDEDYFKQEIVVVENVICTSK